MKTENLESSRDLKLARFWWSSESGHLEFVGSWVWIPVPLKKFQDDQDLWNSNLFFTFRNSKWRSPWTTSTTKVRSRSRPTRCTSSSSTRTADPATRTDGSSTAGKNPASAPSTEDVIRTDRRNRMRLAPSASTESGWTRNVSNFFEDYPGQVVNLGSLFPCSLQLTTAHVPFCTK